MTEKSTSSDSNSVSLSTLTSVLDKLGEIARIASEGSFVFRGEPKYYPEISSSLYREYKTMLEPFGVDGFDIRNVQEEILVDAARYTEEISPSDLLSQLQHYGHPTNLIDFTTDYLIALFFACESELRDDGRLILLDIEANAPSRMRSPANRIKAQKSVFVNPSSGLVSPDHVVRIPWTLKLPMLEYLSSHHDISAPTIYDDIHGFIKNTKTHRSAYMEFHIGGLHLGRGNLEEALNHYNRSINLNGYQKASLANRAVTFMRMKKYDEAIGDFTRVIAIDNHDARAYRERGMAHFDNGQLELAEEDYNEAIRLDPTMEDAYIGRAALRLTYDNSSGAMQDLDIVRALNPQNSAAYNGRGAVFAATGDNDSALRELSTAIELAPTDPNAYMTRAVLHASMQRYEEAIDDFSSYLSAGGDDQPEAHFRRGLALMASGSFEEARSDVRNALEQDPTVVSRVIARFSEIADGSENLVLQNDIPTDLLEMLRHPE